MPAPQGLIRMHQQGQTATFQVEGWTTMNQSLSFRRSAEQALANGTRVLKVDLRQCTFMDSTFIGTLLFLKRAAHRQPGGEFFLVCPSAACGRLFKQMGLEGVFPCVNEEGGPCGGTELNRVPDDVKALQCNVIQAHQELASLDGPAGEQFRAVARCLEQDLKAQQAK